MSAEANSGAGEAGSENSKTRNEFHVQRQAALFALFNAEITTDESKSLADFFTIKDEELVEMDSEEKQQISEMEKPDEIEKDTSSLLSRLFGRIFSTRSNKKSPN